MRRHSSFTCQRERSGLLRDGLADGGISAVVRDSLDEEASDGLDLGSPGERDGGLPHLRHLHPAGWAEV